MLTVNITFYLGVETDTSLNSIIRLLEHKDKLVSNLERQNQELNDYAHMVSHDLKSPLQSLDALTTWIKEDYSNSFIECLFVSAIRSNYL